MNTENNSLGWTPLHYDVFEERPLDDRKKEYVNIQDKNGRTPLHIAAKYARSPGVVAKLLKWGADITILNNDGLTPTQLAQQGNDNVRVFLEEQQNQAEKIRRQECERLERERLRREREEQEQRERERIEQERRKNERKRLAEIEQKRLDWKQAWNTEHKNRLEKLDHYLSSNQIHEPKVIAKQRHKYPVTSLAVSPDSALVLSGSEDSILRLWDTVTGNELFCFEGHTERIKSVAFSPCGNFALSGSVDTTIRMWDIKSGEEVKCFEGHRLAVESVAFSPDGQEILSGSWDCTAKLWDVATGDEIRTFHKHTDHIWSVGFSPCGKFIVTGGKDCLFNIWNAREGSLRLSIDTAPNAILGVHSFDSGLAFTAHDDGIVRSWDIRSGKSAHEFSGHNAALWSIVAYRGMMHVMVSCGKDRGVKLWDVDNYDVIYSYEHLAAVRSAVLSPDGRFLVSGDENGEIVFQVLPDFFTDRDKRTNRERIEKERIEKERREKEQQENERIEKERIEQERLRHEREQREKREQRDKERLKNERIKKWETAHGKRLTTLENHLSSNLVFAPRTLAKRKINDPITSIAISPDSTLVLSGSEDSTMRLWDILTGNELFHFEGHTERIKSVAFSPCGNYALSGSVDATAKLWDIKSGEEILSFEGHRYPVESAVFSPDGRKVLTGSWDTTLKLWDADTGDEIQTFEGHDAEVWTVSFSRNGNYCLSGGNDQVLCVWNIHDGNCIAKIDTSPNKIRSAEFVPGKNMILAAHDDGVVRVWEVFSGKILHEFSGHVDSLWSATASSEYSFVSCGKDKFVMIWDLYEDRLVHTFEDHAQSVRAAVVSTNGRLLVSGDDNGEVFFRLLPPGFIKSREDVKELRRQEEAEKAEKKRQDDIMSMLENLFSADHEGNNVEEVFYAISQVVSAGDVVHVWRGTPFTAKWLIKQEWVPSEIKSQIENLIKNILKNEEDSRLRRKCYLTGYALYSVFVCFLLMCVTSFAPVFVLIAFVIGLLLTWIFFLFLSHEMNVIERRLFLLIPTAFLFFILLIKTSLVVATFSTLTASIFALVSCHFISERIINSKD